MPKQTKKQLGLCTTKRCTGQLTSASKLLRRMFGVDRQGATVQAVRTEAQIGRVHLPELPELWKSGRAPAQRPLSAD